MSHACMDLPLMQSDYNLLQCSDTVSRFGIFCAFMNAMECCKAEGTVDVFQVVRALRIQKPGVVPTVVRQLWHRTHSIVYCI